MSQIDSKLNYNLIVRVSVWWHGLGVGQWWTSLNLMPMELDFHF